MVAIVSAALKENEKRVDEAGNIISLPFKVKLTFTYLKKDAAGEHTLEERVVGFPSSWANGGQGRNVMIFRDAKMEDFRGVFLLSYMSQIEKSSA